MITHPPAYVCKICWPYCTNRWRHFSKHLGELIYRTKNISWRHKCPDKVSMSLIYTTLLLKERPHHIGLSDVAWLMEWLLNYVSAHAAELYCRLTSAVINQYLKRHVQLSSARKHHIIHSCDQKINSPPWHKKISIGLTSITCCNMIDMW